MSTADPPPTYETFMAAYPTAAVESWSRSRAYWDALSPAEQAAAMAGIAPMIADLKAQGRRIMPSVPRYLDRFIQARAASDETLAAGSSSCP